MSPSDCMPEAITREPARAVMTKSVQDPHSGELGSAMDGVVATAGEDRQAQPNSSVTASPSRKQMEPTSIGGNSRIAWNNAAQ